MNFWNTITVGLNEMRAHKFRSFLTMLGIVLGVSSLVAVSALARGMENGMRELLIARGGLNKVAIDEEDVPPHQQHLRDMAPGCTLRDVYALRESATLIELVSPEMELDDAVVSRRDKTTEPSELMGVWPAALEMNMHTVEHGRFFTEIDDLNALKVCVIGTGIRDELFGSLEKTGKEINPVGETILINDQPFEIVGMFMHYESEADRKARNLAKAKGGTFRPRNTAEVFEDKNETVYIPLNTMWVRFRSSSGAGNIADPRLTEVNLKLRDINQIEAALQQARNILLLTHHGIEDFEFTTRENYVENIRKTSRNARVTGGIIAAISLVAGGIGIMNIMLASITERVREVGIRQAIGATQADIFSQVLIESAVLACIGGLLGLICSYGLVNLLENITSSKYVPVITYKAMAVAFVFSATVGVIAGLFPAFKASRLSPVQAFRYE